MEAEAGFLFFSFFLLIAGTLIKEANNSFCTITVRDSSGQNSQESPTRV